MNVQVGGAGVAARAVVSRLASLLSVGAVFRSHPASPRNSAKKGTRTLEMPVAPGPFQLFEPIIFCIRLNKRCTFFGKTDLTQVNKLAVCRHRGPGVKRPFGAVTGAVAGVGFVLGISLGFAGWRRQADRFPGLRYR